MRWRTVRRVTAAVVVGLVPVAVGAVGIARAAGEVYTARDGAPPPRRRRTTRPSRRRWWC
jgi:hypothetical protein